MEKGRGERTDTLQTDNVFTRKEYIEREAAKDAVCKAFVRWGSEDQYHESTHQIDRIPAADVVAPVKHGEWIRCGDGDNVPYLCSHCGKTAPSILVENWVGVKYCPMCGALMDKDGDGDVS